MIFIFLAAAAAQSQPPGPRAWLEGVYAEYRKADFNPFDHPDRYFAPRLVAAMAEDARLAHGEVGYVDGDPICQCQDPAGMHPSIVRVTQQGKGKAIVQVSIGWDNDKPRPTRFSLVRVGGGWRIADVSSADEPSFLGAIEKSNREKQSRERRR